MNKYLIRTDVCLMILSVFTGIFCIYASAICAMNHQVFLAIWNFAMIMLNAWNFRQFYKSYKKHKYEGKK